MNAQLGGIRWRGTVTLEEWEVWNPQGNDKPGARWNKAGEEVYEKINWLYTRYKWRLSKHMNKHLGIFLVSI